MKSEARRRALGEASRRLVEQRYTWTVVARTTLDLLAQLAAWVARSRPSTEMR